MNKIANNVAFYSFLTMILGLAAVVAGFVSGGSFAAGIAGGGDTNSFFVGVLLYGGVITAVLGLLFTIVALLIKMLTRT